MRKHAAALLLAMLLLPFGAFADAQYTMAGYESTSSHDWNNNFALQRIEEKTGVSISFNQYTEEADWTAAKAALKAGSADLPDALFKADLTDSETQRLYQEGVLIDLKPYLEENAPDLWALLQAHPEWEEAITLSDGAIVALPNINELQNENAIWINTAWLSKLKLDMPTTLEEFTSVLRAFKTGDPNSNGKADEIPLEYTGMWDLRWLAHAFGIYSNDYYVVLEDGTVRETVTSDENRAFLTWLHQLWTEGLIDHDGLSSTSSTRQISDSDATITYGIVMGPSVLQMLPSTQLENYQVMMPLKYNGQQVYRKLFHDVNRGTFAITSACKDPAALVRWANFFYTEEGCYLAQAGMAGKEYDIRTDGTWYWVDDATTISETILPDYTIADGTMMPMYTPVSYQLNYDDESTHTAVTQLQELNQYTKEPYPLVYLDDATQAKVTSIWSSLGSYAETAMARFVVGDVELTDASWKTFCDTVNSLGMP